MKRFLFLLALLASALPAFAQTEALKQDLTTGLVTPKRQPVFTITPGVTSSAKISSGLGSVFYLGIRNDSLAGSGTATDPYDAGTAAKLDTLFPTLPAFATIHFMEGLFLTSTGLVLKDGQHVIMEPTTTLRLANGAMPAGTYTGASQMVRNIFGSASDLSGNIVEGGTIDGNRQNQGAYTSSSAWSFQYPLNLLGKNCQIKNVKVINTFSSPEGEGFPIIIATSAGTYDSPAVGIIDGVRFDNHDGYCTAMSLLAPSLTVFNVTGVSATNIVTTSAAHGYSAGDTIYFSTLTGGSGLTAITQKYFVRDVATTTTFKVALSNNGTAVALGTNIAAGTCIKQTWIAGAIRNCILTDNATGAYSKMQAFGCGGWKDVTVENNVVLNLWTGYFTDTHNYENVTIQNNYMKLRPDPVGFAGFGVFTGGGYTWKNYTIRGNTFVQGYNCFAIAIRGYSQDFLVDNNTTISDSTYAVGGRVAVQIYEPGNSNIRVTNNRFDPDYGLSALPALGSALTYSLGNRFRDGTLIADLPEPFGPTAIVRSTTTSGAGDIVVPLGELALYENAVFRIRVATLGNNVVGTSATITVSARQNSTDLDATYQSRTAAVFKLYRKDAGASRTALFLVYPAVPNAGTVTATIYDYPLAATVQTYTATTEVVIRDLAVSYSVGSLSPGNAAFDWAPATMGGSDLGNTYLRWKQLWIDNTVTAAGQTGAKTINKLRGTVRFAAAATTLVVTNSLVYPATKIAAYPIGAFDATATHFTCTATTGSFTITANAAATAETEVAFDLAQLQ